MVIVTRRTDLPSRAAAPVARGARRDTGHREDASSTALREDLRIAEERIEEVERVNAALLATQSDLDEGILLVEGERIVLANEAAERFLGRTRDDLLALSSLFDLVAPDQRGLFADHHVRRLAGDPLPARERVVFERPGTATLALEVTTRVVHGPTGTRSVLVLRFPLEHHPSVADDGAAARLEADLRTLEDRYSLVADHSRDLVAIVDAAGRYVFASPSFETVLGAEPRLLQGNLVADLVHPDDRAAVNGILARSLGSAPTLVRLRQADRSWRWILLAAEPVAAPGGPLSLLVGRDVSERRGAEAERAHLQAILDRVQDAVVTIALDGQIIGWNAGAERVYGYGAKEMVGRNLSLLVPPGAPDDVPLLLDGLRRGEAPAPFDAERRRKDGSRLHVGLKVVPLRDAGEEIVGASIVATDLTEPRRFERLRATQLEIDRVLAEASILDEAALRFLETLGRGLGWDVATLWLSTPDGATIGPRRTWSVDDPALARFAAATTGAVARRGEGVVGIVWSTGRPVWVRDVAKERRLPRAATAAAEGLHTLAAIPIQSTSAVHGVLELFARERNGPDEDMQRLLLSVGAQVGLFLERNRAVEEVRRLNQELEARVAKRTHDLESANRELEAFSYSVSHDLKAPLRTIEGFTRNIVEDYGSKLDEQGLFLLERIRAASKRMGRLIDDLLKLSRATSAQLRKQDIDVSAMVTAIAAQLQASEPSRSVDVRVAPGVRGLADPDLLRVALENLLNNAWKFTRNRPTARIEFAAEQHADETVYTLHDNGAGFDMTYAAKLFQPFERLHPSSEFEGSGIGLATVQRIVRRHGGRVWAEARPEEGATFRFTLGST